jgi:acetoin utilization deacetylase AcuC-like enzyme
MITYFHPDQLLHSPQGYFSRGKLRAAQELPERASHLLEAVKVLGFELRVPENCGFEPLASVHSMAYLQFLQSAHAEWTAQGEDWGDEVMANIHVRTPNALRGILARAGFFLADGSCPIGAHTWASVNASAQSAVAAARLVTNGTHRAYALCRPPGHHARRDAAGGFCYLNNAAIAAEVLRQRFDRVLVLDLDMHHGQGVQEIFYRRADVTYVSIHGDPTNFYPATAGFEEERGEAAGQGFNFNLPMPHASAEAVFFERLEQALKIVRTLVPPVIVLCLGFDIYTEDPQAKVSVSTEGFGRIGMLLKQLNIPILIVQEGGYHLQSLERNARSFFGGLG